MNRQLAGSCDSGRVQLALSAKITGKQLDPFDNSKLKLLLLHSPLGDLPRAAWEKFKPGQNIQDETSC